MYNGHKSKQVSFQKGVIMKRANRVLALYLILGFVAIFLPLQVRAEPNAEQGDADAQFNLGVKYYYGEGIPQDFKKAIYWYTKAAEQGDVRAQFSLGAKYYDGEGAPQNNSRAAYWFTKAAEQGNIRAQNLLGTMYYEGLRVPQDYVKAVHWFTKAAEQGEVRAQSLLGIMYYSGEGVPQDYVKAYVMLNRAASQGNATSKYNREILLKLMSSTQIEEGQKLSKYFNKKGYNKEKIN